MLFDLLEWLKEKDLCVMVEDWSLWRVVVVWLLWVYYYVVKEWEGIV